MSYLRMILVGVLAMWAVTGSGQPTPLTEDEILELKKLAEYNTRWNIFLNVWAVVGPLLAVIATWLGLRKKAEDWAEKEITQKANEKFGVDWAIIKTMVDEKRRDIAIKAKRLAVVNKTTGRRQDLVTTLATHGFKNPPPQFFNLADFNTKFDYNQFDLIILDNHDNQLTEAELREIIRKYQFPYVFYTITDTSPAFFDEFKGKVKFAKIQENIPEYIIQSF